MLRVVQVTLIHNLETFGVDPGEFAHSVQKGMACSTSTSPLPGKNRGVEVLVQGNQVAYVAKLLMGELTWCSEFLIRLSFVIKVYSMNPVSAILHLTLANSE